MKNTVENQSEKLVTCAGIAEPPGHNGLCIEQVNMDTGSRLK